MKRLLAVCLLMILGAVASAAGRTPRPEIMGVALGMSRDDALTRLRSLGNLEREEKIRQEVWAVKDPRISHLLVGYDTENRVRYVTALTRSGGPRIRYAEIANIKQAQSAHNQSHYKFVWEVAARRGQFAYVMIAQGHDRQYLDSYSVKKLDQEEID